MARLKSAKNALSNRKTSEGGGTKAIPVRPPPPPAAAPLKQNVYHKVIEVYHCWPHQHKQKAKVTVGVAWKPTPTTSSKPALKWKSSRSLQTDSICVICPKESLQTSTAATLIGFSGSGVCVCQWVCGKNGKLQWTKNKPQLAASFINLPYLELELELELSAGVSRRGLAWWFPGQRQEIFNQCQARPRKLMSEFYTGQQR